MRYWLIVYVFLPLSLYANKIEVGKNFSCKSIQEAINKSKNNDSVIVYEGNYAEGNIIVDKEIFLIGINNPVLDGQKKVEILSVKANNVYIAGFKIINSGFASLDDPCAIKVYDRNHVIFEGKILEDNFFGIYLQYCTNCIVRNNRIISSGKEEQLIGNGIHCWKSDSLQIIANKISGHRDGIYFEFVTNSIIWRNISTKNLRYGLHFMFSNNDSYITNVFKNNGAGVSVMFTKGVKMIKATVRPTNTTNIVLNIM